MILRSGGDPGVADDRPIRCPNPARSARVGTGGRRWQPPVVQRASLRSDRWHGGWHRQATGRSSLRHPCNRKARVRSAPVGNGTAHHSGRRPARWGSAGWRSASRDVTRPAAWPAPVDSATIRCPNPARSDGLEPADAAGSLRWSSAHPSVPIGGRWLAPPSDVPIVTSELRLNGSEFTSIGVVGLAVFRIGHLGLATEMIVAVGGDRRGLRSIPVGVGLGGLRAASQGVVGVRGLRRLHRSDPVRIGIDAFGEPTVVVVLQLRAASGSGHRLVVITGVDRRAPDPRRVGLRGPAVVRTSGRYPRAWCGCGFPRAQGVDGQGLAPRLVRSRAGIVDSRAGARGGVDMSKSRRARRHSRR